MTAVETLPSSKKYSQPCSIDSVTRAWPAMIDLRFQRREARTVLVHNEHVGPLRVFKPYYPEGRDKTAHIYLLHPPGGMVVGDLLNIQVEAGERTRCLLTTPSAGKIYGTKDLAYRQTQNVNIDVGKDGCVEWFPQETIIFNGAKGQLNTQVNLDDKGQAALWDIICLGRPAGDKPFRQGECLQTLRVSRDGKLLHIERNLFDAGNPLMKNAAGLQDRCTHGTFLLTVNDSVDRKKIEVCLTEVREALDYKFQSMHSWGLTQKNSIILIRYLGDSASVARAGFELAWVFLRPLFNGDDAVEPRIWRT